jgi:predicted nucleotidyltransferase
MDSTVQHTTHQSEFSRFGAGLGELCRRYHVRRLMVFGSTMTGGRRLDSDIDLLVEFQPGHAPGLGFARLADELGNLLGVPVDLHTPGSLSRYFRDQVLEEARVVYAEKE